MLVPVEIARLERLDHDLGAGGKLAEDRAAVGGFEIQRDAALVAVEVEMQAAGLVVGEIVGPRTEGA